MIIQHNPSSPEEWRQIAGFPDYQVSNEGRVASHRPWRGKPVPRELNGSLGGNGYRMVHLARVDEGPTERRYVHHLVAEAFHGDRPAGYAIRHLDGDKTNNAADNLRYGTAAENEADKIAHGTHNHASKTHCPQGHAYTAENTYRPPSKPNSRECRACQKSRLQARWLRDRAARSEDAA